MVVVLPLLLLVLFGIIDFGFMFQRYVVLTNAAMEGARVGILPGYHMADAQESGRDRTRPTAVCHSGWSTRSPTQVTPTRPAGRRHVAGGAGGRDPQLHLRYIGPILSMFGGSMARRT